jgi:riboflavin biosynthesis pyrimidine reductase
MTRNSGRPTPGPQRCLRANFVTTIDGHIQGPDGLSGTISSAEDRRVFHMLRAGADAILVGAGTARIENYKPVGVKAEWARVPRQ